MTSGVLSHITPKRGVSIKVSNEDKKGWKLQNKMFQIGKMYIL